MLKNVLIKFLRIFWLFGGAGIFLALGILDFWQIYSRNFRIP